VTRRFDLLAACAAAAAALAAPCTVLAVAWTTSFTACLDSATTEACGRKDLATIAFIVACTGFVPVLTLAWALWAGRIRLAGLAFASAIVIYGLWALLNDAATHGWNDLWLLPG
jgi:hypothetical protein